MGVDVLSNNISISSLVGRIYCAAFIKANVMTAKEHDRQIHTRENKAIVWMRANRDAFTGIGFWSFSSGINRARCWSLNWPLFRAQMKTTMLITKPADMYAIKYG